MINIVITFHIFELNIIISEVKMVSFHFLHWFNIFVEETVIGRWNMCTQLFTHTYKHLMRWRYSLFLELESLQVLGCQLLQTLFFICAYFLLKFIRCKILFVVFQILLAEESRIVLQFRGVVDIDGWFFVKEIVIYDFIIVTFFYAFK